MSTGAKRQPKKKKKADQNEQIEPSGGNVFADLGFPDPEEHLAKAELAKKICDIIDQRRLTQAKAAEIHRVDQPKISALVRGRIIGFSTDRLFRSLNALGHEVEILIHPAARIRSSAGLRISPMGRQPIRPPNSPFSDRALVQSGPRCWRPALRPVTAHEPRSTCRAHRC